VEFWQNIPLPKLVKRFDIRWPIAIKQEKLVNDVIRISLPTSRTHLRVFFISGVGGEGAQKITWKSRKKWPKIFSGNFGEMRAKSFAPLKITCSYNYVFYVCNFFLFLLSTLFCFTLNVIFFFCLGESSTVISTQAAKNVQNFCLLKRFNKAINVD